MSAVWLRDEDNGWYLYWPFKYFERATSTSLLSLGFHRHLPLPADKRGVVRVRVCHNGPQAPTDQLIQPLFVQAPRNSPTQATPTPHTSGSPAMNARAPAQAKGWAVLSLKFQGICVICPIFLDFAPPVRHSGISRLKSSRSYRCAALRRCPPLGLFACAIFSIDL